MTEKFSLHREQRRSKLKNLVLEKIVPQPNEDLLRELELFVNGYNLSFLRINKERSESILEDSGPTKKVLKETKKERLLREIPSIAIFINTIHQLLAFQFNNKEKVSDDDILNILPILLTKVPISREIYQSIHSGLRELLTERKRFNELIKDDEQTKKRMIFSTKITLSPEQVHEIASRIKIVESIFGPVIYTDSEILKKLYSKDYSVGGFHRGNFEYITNPTKYKKNKSNKYKIKIPLIVVGTIADKETGKLLTKKFRQVKVHEEFHRLYHFFQKNFKTTITESEQKKIIKRIKSLRIEYLLASGDISDKESNKYKKLVEYYVKSFEILNFKKKAYDQFLNELCAQIEGGALELRLRKETDPELIKEYLNFYNNKNWSYYNSIFNSINNSKPNEGNIKNPQELDILNEEKEKFKDATRKEFGEITEIIFRIYSKYKFTRLILYTIITTENPFEVKNKLLILEKSLELHYNNENGSNL